jgi:hypothetical protein
LEKGFLGKYQDLDFNGVYQFAKIGRVNAYIVGKIFMRHQLQ